MSKVPFLQLVLFGLFCILWLLQPKPLPAQMSYQSAYAEGLEAKNEGLYTEYLEKMQMADSLRPNHRIILLELARAYTANGLQERALQVLRYRSDFYAVADFKEEDFWKELERLPAHKSLLENLELRNATEEHSVLAFELEKPGFHAEGMAYNEKANRFYLSDVRCGEILSILPNGKEVRKEYDLKKWGYWGAMGMLMDPEKDELWVTSSALPNYCAYEDSLEGSSAVLKIDLKQGELIGVYHIEGKHVFGDLTQDKDGTVWVSDSSTPVVYKVDQKRQTLVPVVEDARFWNLQGLAPMGDHLYISDYITGLYSFEIRTGSLTEVSADNQRLRGTDGLYAVNGELYLLQNGTRPFRLSSIAVNGTGHEVSGSYKLWDQATDHLGEPTLGAWKSGQFYFIANSPWGYYDEEDKARLSEWPLLQVRVIKP